MTNDITSRIARNLRDEGTVSALVALLTSATVADLEDLAARSRVVSSFISTGDRRAIRAASLELAEVLSMGLYSLKVDGRAWTRDATRAAYLTAAGCEMGQADIFDPSDRTVVDGFTLEGFVSMRREGCEELAAELAPLRVYS